MIIYLIEKHFLPFSKSVVRHILIFKIKVSYNSFLWENLTIRPRLCSDTLGCLKTKVWSPNLVYTQSNQHCSDDVVQIFKNKHHKHTHKAFGGSGAGWTWSEGKLHYGSASSSSAQTSELHFLCLCEPISYEKEI